MKISYLYEENSELFARLRNVNQYWNFITHTWGSQATNDCRVALVEYPYAAGVQSLYAVEVADPTGGSCLVEIVLATGECLDAEASHKEPDNETILAGIAEVSNGVGTLLDIGQGSWVIINSQMIFYDRAGDELMRFDLLDRSGVASETDVFQRIPL